MWKTATSCSWILGCFFCWIFVDERLIEYTSYTGRFGKRKGSPQWLANPFAVCETCFKKAESLPPAFFDHFGKAYAVL